MLSSLLAIAAVQMRGVPLPPVPAAAPIGGPSVPRLLASAALLLLAMLSKAAAVPITGILLCADFVVVAEGGRNARQQPRDAEQVWLAVWCSLRRNAAAILAAALGAAAATSANPANQTGHTELDGVALVLRACYSFWCYPVMSLMPKGMIIRYRAHHEEILLSDLRFGTAAVATAMLLAWLLLLAVRLLCPRLLAYFPMLARPVGQRELRAGAISGAYVIAVLPTLGLFVQHGEPLLAADRYSYIPALFLGTPLVAMALDHAISEWQIRRSAVVGVAVAAVGVCCALSRDYSAAFGTRELLWRRAVSLDPSDSGTVNQLALALQKDGRHEESVPLFDRATQLRPDFADAWSNAGRSLLEMGRLEEALPRWDKAIAIKEHHRDSWLNRGVAYERYGRLAEAGRDYEHVVASHPTCGSAWYNYGNLNERLGRTGEAERCFRQAVHLQPRQPDFHNNLANSMRDEAARNDEALHSYSSAIALKPSFLGARFNKASLLASMRRTQEAVADYTAVLEQDPSYRQALVARGNAYLGSEELDRAEADYRASLRSDPQSVSELNNLCLVLHRLDRLDEALSTCRGALALDGTHGWARYNLGTTQHKLGLVSSDVAAQSQLYEASISSYRRVVSDHPGWVVVWESLEKVLSSASRMAESRAISAHARGLRQTLSTEGVGVGTAAATASSSRTSLLVSDDAEPKDSVPNSPSAPALASGLRAVSAAEVAGQLKQQRETEPPPVIDQSVPVLSAASLTNLATQRLTVRPEDTPLSVTAQEQVAVDNAPTKRGTGYLKPVPPSEQRIRLPNPTQPSASIDVVIPKWKPPKITADQPINAVRPSPSRGIVVVTSGSEPSLLREAYATVYLARRVHNSTLPIEVFHIGPEEKFDAASTRLFEELGGVAILDLRATSLGAAASLEGGRMGFHAKSAAMLATSFDEVLLLDSDSILFQAPEEFFLQPGYAQSGFLLFRDYQPCRESRHTRASKSLVSA